MKKPTWQYFSLEEYQQRLDVLRRRMEQKGLDAVLVHSPENLYYLSGHQTPGYYWYQVLIVPLDREPVFITRLLEESNVHHLSWVEESRPYGDSDDWVAKTGEVLVELGLGDSRIGIDKRSWFFTVDDFERLSSRLSSATLVDCSGIVEEGRMIKSPAELSYMKQAAEVAGDAMRAGIDACAVGATENKVAAAVHDAQIKAGSEYTALPIFVTTGPRSALGHATWYRQEIEAGNTVFLGVPGCINRYHAALMRNVHMGEPPKRMIRATDAIATALEETIAFMRPGVTAHDAHEVCSRAIAQADLGVTLDHRTAYSIGVGFAPDWGEGQIISLKEGEHRPFQKGMTFHIVPVVFIPGLTSVVVSETVVLTDTGCEALTSGVGRRLFVR